MTFRPPTRHRRPPPVVYTAPAVIVDKTASDTATVTASAVKEVVTLGFPDVTVEMAFGNNPFDATMIWTDVTLFVVGDITIDRGRQHELGRIETGTMSTTLTSVDDRWNPENASGAYWPDVKPLVPVRLRALDPFTGVDSVVYRGFVKGFPQRWVAAGKISKVPIQCVDAMGMFARVPVTDWTTAVLVDSPVGFWRFSDLVTTLVDSAGHINNHNGTIAGLPERGTTSDAVAGFDTDTQPDRIFTFDAADDLVDSFANVNDLRIDGDMTVETWVLLRDQAFTGTLLRCNTPAGADILYGVDVINGTGTRVVNWDQGSTFTQGVTLNTDQWYHLVFVRQSTVLTVYVDGVLTGTSPLKEAAPTPATQQLAFGAIAGAAASMDAQVSEIVIYDKALTAGRVRAHFNSAFMFGGGSTSQQMFTSLLDSVGWPSGDRRIFGSTPQADRIPSVAIDETLAAVFRRISESQDGTIWVERDGEAAWATRHYRATSRQTPSATFGDGGGTELEYRDLNMPGDDTMIRNIWRVTPEGGVTEEAQDQASVTSHGPREESIDNALIGSDATSTISQSNATARAQAGLARTKDATHRIESLTVTGMGQAEAWQHIILSDVHDRIKIIRRAPGGGTVTKEAHIEHVAHRISHKTWETTWRLSPAETQNLWVLDDAVMSVLDTSTVLAW